MTARDREAECERFVADLLGMMSAEEKAGQLAIQSAPDPNDRAACDQFDVDLRSGRIGSVTGLDDAEQAERLQRIAQDKTRLGIPLLFPAATGHGLATVLPTPLAAAASWDEERIEAAEAVVGQEAAARGINWSLSPSFVLSTPGATAIPSHSLGEQALLAARLTAARIRGFQGSPGGQATGRLGTLDLTDLLARPGAITDSDAAAILQIVNVVATQGRVGSIAIDELSAERRRTVEAAFRVLVGPGGYDGILLPEWAALSDALPAHGRDTRSKGVPLDALVEALARGRISKARIDDAVGRVLRAKYRLGLFEAAHAATARRVVHALPTPIHNRETALALARHCPVMLRNEPALLPLGIDSGDILLVGPGASDRHLPLAGSPGLAASVIDGFEHLGIPHRYVSGLALRDNGSSLREMMAADGMAIGMAGEAARRSGTVVAVLANDETGAFGAAQHNLLSVLASANPRLVLVNLGPRPVDPWLQGKPLASVLHAGALGTASGHAIAEILSGECSPSGKLPVSIGAEQGRGGLPFGYGLGYAECALTDLTLRNEQSSLQVFVNLRNVSECAGSEVVQMYLRRTTQTTGEQPLELVDFRKLALRPGQVETVAFEIGREEIGRYQPDGSFRVEAGIYDVFVGLDAQRGLAARVEIGPDFARAIAHAALHRRPARRA